MLAFLQQWAKALPGPGSGHFHNHYGYALLHHGLYTDAEREFRAYLRVSPNEANPHDSLAELFVLTGRPEHATEHYEQALRLNPLFGFSHLGMAYAGAMRGQYEDAVASMSKLEELGSRAGVSAATVQLTSAFIRSRAGRYREADLRIGAGRRLAREAGDAANEAESWLVEAVLAQERGQTARAVEAARQAAGAAERVPAEALRTRFSSLAQLTGGIIEASAGRLESAAAHLAAQRRLNRGNDVVLESWERALAAQIALSEGRLADAEVDFGAAEPPARLSGTVPNLGLQTMIGILANNGPVRDGLARVMAARRDFKDAVALYARLNRPHIADRRTPVLEPRFVLASARLADRAGDRETARKEYARFLELWQDADEGLPEPGEARRYLRREGADVSRLRRQEK
jgi:tetratricopeptide (TPR) repeat protein